MTQEQKKYLEFVQKAYRDHLCDITRTIVWMNLHYRRMPPDVQSAYRSLSSQERNEVIMAVCQSKETGPKLDYFDDYHAHRNSI